MSLFLFCKFGPKVLNFNIFLCFFFPPHPHSRVVILASSVRQPVLPLSGAAGLHDAERHERLSESEGALTTFTVTSRSRSEFWPGLCNHSVFVALLISSKVCGGWTAAAISTVCWAPAFCPVTSPLKKSMLKCSPLLMCQSIMWESGI